MARRRKKRVMTLLLDTGPLVALLDEDDPHHQAVVKALAQLSGLRLVTTCPCVTEAMYLLGKLGGQRYQEKCWRLLFNEAVEIYSLTVVERQRMHELMTQYADTPMDYADASLVTAAESLEVRRVFTLDDDFYVYRLADGTMLEVVR